MGRLQSYEICLLYNLNIKAYRIHIISNGKGEFYIFLLQQKVNGLSSGTLLFPNVNKSEIFFYFKKFLNFECHCNLDISLILNITIFVIIF